MRRNYEQDFWRWRARNSERRWRQGWDADCVVEPLECVEASWGFVVGGFLLPVALGNILGGTALFGLIAYGQVAHEIRG